MVGSNVNQLCVHGRCDDCPECVPHLHDSIFDCEACWNDAVERGDADRKAKLSDPELLVPAYVGENNT